MENPIKMDDLGVPLVLETPLSQKKKRKIRLPGVGQIGCWDSSGGGDRFDGLVEGVEGGDIFFRLGRQGWLGYNS